MYVIATWIELSDHAQTLLTQENQKCGLTVIQLSRCKPGLHIQSWVHAWLSECISRTKLMAFALARIGLATVRLVSECYLNQSSQDCDVLVCLLQATWPLPLLQRDDAFQWEASALRIFGVGTQIHHQNSFLGPEQSLIVVVFTETVPDHSVRIQMLSRLSQFSSLFPIQSRPWHRDHMCSPGSPAMLAPQSELSSSCK